MFYLCSQRALPYSGFIGRSQKKLISARSSIPKYLFEQHKPILAPSKSLEGTSIQIRHASAGGLGLILAAITGGFPLLGVVAYSLFINRKKMKVPLQSVLPQLKAILSNPKIETPTELYIALESALDEGNAENVFKYIQKMGVILPATAKKPMVVKYGINHVSMLEFYTQEQLKALVDKIDKYSSEIIKNRYCNAKSILGFAIHIDVTQRLDLIRKNCLIIEIKILNG